ncbi:MAG: helix-turn-helix domain-containing protein [Legionella sp.]|nr:helix-turn-helix domain-containing protein [Legionella sp.]
MSTIPIMNETQDLPQTEQPGAQLARVREKKGYSQEFVASKLHLRVRVIELLEADDYASMPEPVFIKGYLRAYANLLGIEPAPLLSAYNHFPLSERSLERTLWQAKREAPRGVQTLRWFTAMVALGVLITVGVWWQKNKDNLHLARKSPTALQETSKKENADLPSELQNADERESTSDTKLKLTDLSKMQVLLPSQQNRDASLGQNRE